MKQRLCTVLSWSPVLLEPETALSCWPYVAQCRDDGADVDTDDLAVSCVQVLHGGTEIEEEQKLRRASPGLKPCMEAAVFRS